MNIFVRILTFLISFIPTRSWPQDPPRYEKEMPTMKADYHVELLDLEDVDETQAQINEIKRQIKELQERMTHNERTRYNNLRRRASSRDELRRSTKD